MQKKTKYKDLNLSKVYEYKHKDVREYDDIVADYGLNQFKRYKINKCTLKDFITECINSKKASDISLKDAGVLNSYISAIKSILNKNDVYCLNGCLSQKQINQIIAIAIKYKNYCQVLASERKEKLAKDKKSIELGKEF